MDDTQTPTRAQLDALLADQEAKHIERLRRRANRSYLWVLLSLLPLACIALAFRLEKQWPPAIVTGSIVTMTFIGLAGFILGRKEAARQLAKELSR
jgi:hypothetical protein